MFPTGNTAFITEFFCSGFCGYEPTFLQGEEGATRLFRFPALRRPYNGLTGNEGMTTLTCETGPLYTALLGEGRAVELTLIGGAHRPNCLLNG